MRSQTDRITTISGALIVVLFSACGPRTTDTETAREHGETAAQLIDEEQALVQVLIYGLAAFEIERDANEKPTKITALMPRAALHTPNLAAGRIINGKREWLSVQDVPDTTITFDLAGLLDNEKGTNTLGEYPTSKQEAADIRWMLRYGKIDDNPGIDPSEATTRIVFEAGTLETCGLVHAPREGPSVCKVEVKNDKNYIRSISEYMVLRHPVAFDTSEVEVILTAGAQEQRIPIAPTCGPCPITESVTWNGTTYKKIFNIALRNPFDQPEERTMDSHHADNHLKDLFPNAAKSWYMVSPDCNDDDGDGVWECPDCNRQDRQPFCWDYFQTFEGSFGGMNRPICPFVEHP